MIGSCLGSGGLVIRLSTDVCVDCNGALFGAVACIDINVDVDCGPSDEENISVGCTCG
jgi:hypothetical protein